MAVKIRLARKGRKKLAYYHIVVADSRSPRDGRYIEKIGSYNPVTNPATIELQFDKALGWLQNGAIPTDTCRAILSYKGVLIKKHLLDGVKKGAFDEAEATRRFDEWMKKNEEKIETKKSNLEKSYDDDLGKRLSVEKSISEARAAKITKRNADLAAKEAAALTEEAASIEEVEKVEDAAAVEEVEQVEDAAAVEEVEQVEDAAAVEKVEKVEDVAAVEEVGQVEDATPAEESAPVKDTIPAEESVEGEEPIAEDNAQKPDAEEPASDTDSEDKPQE
jgi:small subunit ribosomal protein S16